VIEPGQGREGRAAETELAVVVVPDHPDRRDEHEQAGHGEDHVQEIDIVGVSD